MHRTLVLMVLCQACFAQELLNTIVLDTARYDDRYVWATYGPTPNQMPVFALLRKESWQVDVYDYVRGQVGTVSLPDLPRATSTEIIYVSQTHFDGDSEWEGYINYYDTTMVYTNGINWRFIVFDQDGSTLLSDRGYAWPAFDGQSTYLRAGWYSGSMYWDPTQRIWRFRTNVASASPSLPKRMPASAPQVDMMGAGDLRISVMPTNSEKLSIQVVDLLGRVVLMKTWPLSKSSADLVIPFRELPRSPFVTRIGEPGCEDSHVKHMVPAR